MSETQQKRAPRHDAEEEAIAYKLQVIGAREGAIKGTLIAGALMLFANWRYPLVQRQTLAGKAFVVAWGSIFGMTTHADKYLLAWEQEHRIAAERWRNEARSELAALGTVPSETAMRAWKTNKDAEAVAKAALVVPKVSSPVLAELEKVKATA